MVLIKNATQVSDPWIYVSDETPLLADIPNIVSFTRFMEERERLFASHAELGVLVSPDEDVMDLQEDLARLHVIALDFPKFTDGRAYSAARILRQRLSYTGEIRAVGEVLRDQYLFMQRAGFDAYQVQEGATVRDWLAAIQEFSHYYQPAADGSQAVWSRRHEFATAQQA